jgi:hypothetical protein
MSAATNYLEATLLDWAFTTDSVTRPTAWTVHLHTGDPGEVGTSNEVSGSGYVEQSATWERTDNEIANDAAITFPTVTSSGYTVTHVSIQDGDSNVLAKGPLDVAKALLVGEALSFATGELKFTLD